MKNVLLLSPYFSLNLKQETNCASHFFNSFFFSQHTHQGVKQYWRNFHLNLFIITFRYY